MRHLSNDAPQRTGPRNDWKTLKTLLPYLWPENARDLRIRVVIALLFLAAAKGLNVSVPIFYKKAVDALSMDSTAQLLAVPIMLLVGYGVARVLSQAFGELRDAVFARVGQRAIRMSPLRPFNICINCLCDFMCSARPGGSVDPLSAAPRVSNFY
jgi:ATP-binding cassette subfamily B protein